MACPPHPRSDGDQVLQMPVLRGCHQARNSTPGRRASGWPGPDVGAKALAQSVLGQVPMNGRTRMEE